MTGACAQMQASHPSALSASVAAGSGKGLGGHGAEPCTHACSRQACPDPTRWPVCDARHPATHLGLGERSGKGGIHGRLLLGCEEARPRRGGGRQRRRQRRQQGQCRQPRGQPQQLTPAGALCSLLCGLLGACGGRSGRTGWACRYRPPGRPDRPTSALPRGLPAALHCGTATCCRRARLGAAPARAGLQAACCMTADIPGCVQVSWWQQGGPGGQKGGGTAATSLGAMQNKTAFEGLHALNTAEPAPAGSLGQGAGGSPSLLGQPAAGCKRRNQSLPQPTCHRRSRRG